MNQINAKQVEEDTTETFNRVICTCGDYATEEEAEVAFDTVIKNTGLFRVYRQIEGHYVQPAITSYPKNGARIDRLLLPSQKLIQAGWDRGAIGVEVKRSGANIGKPISQMLDYMKCVWAVPRGNVHIMLDYCFLWPMDEKKNALASVLAQNRLGGVFYGGRNLDRLDFLSGQVPVLKYFFSEDRIKIGKESGKKSGSR